MISIPTIESKVDFVAQGAGKLCETVREFSSYARVEISYYSHYSYCFAKTSKMISH
jgi:hypothetical protein